MGIAAEEYLDAGDLVPTALTTEMLADRLTRSDANSGFILDGYPRSLDQSHSLNELLEKHRWTIDAVVGLEVDDSTVVERMLARGRADDDRTIIQNRLTVYRDNVAPILSHYDDLLVRVDASGRPSDVLDAIVSSLEARLRPR